MTIKLGRNDKCHCGSEKKYKKCCQASDQDSSREIKEEFMSKQDFKLALENRLAKRLENQSFDEMTVGGSKLRFDMAMAIDGYPFEIPKGANKADYERLLTTEEYISGRYDEEIDAVFDLAAAS